MSSPLAIRIALCLAVATSAFDTARASGSERARTVEGQVEEVRRDDGTVTLRVGEERRQILVAPEAEIRIDDFWGTFADIKEGQRVRASLDETGPQAEGYRIQILDKGARPGTTDQRKSSGRGAAPGARKPDRR